MQRGDEQLINDILPISLRTPQVGDRVCTYAYPGTNTKYTEDRNHELSFWWSMYDGKITDIVNGRYQCDMHIHGGARVGPVFGPDGKVIGVNSLSFHCETNLSLFVPIR